MSIKVHNLPIGAILSNAAFFFFFSDSRTKTNGGREDDIRLMEKLARYLMKFLVSNVFNQKLNGRVQGPAEGIPVL